jgi:glycosyltransferase involved in cell wall biosynthesis
MKILMVVFNQVGRGTYWRAFHRGRFLARRGHLVSLMATSADSRFGIRIRQSEGLTLVETPDLFRGSLRSGWDPWNILNRVNWLRDQDFDLVHVFEGRPTAIYPALYIRNRLQIPLVMDWCDWFGKGGSVEERPNRWMRLLLRPVETYYEEHFRTAADRTTVICSLLRQKALNLGVRPRTILDLPNGSDTERLQPIERSAARLQTKLPSNAFIIGYVGTIFHRDGLLMAEAFNRLLQQAPEALLLIAGYCPLDLRPWVSRPERVIQTGFLSEADLNAYLAASDIFWLPLSDSNANRGRFPLKLTDYMAVGRPIVATRVGDVQIVLEQNQVGLLSRPEPEDLVAQTLRLFHDPDLRQTLGANARRAAESRFNWAHLAEQLEDLYLSAGNQIQPAYAPGQQEST